MNGDIDPDAAAYIDKALTAATRADAEGERRTPTQRRADALVEICRTYLEGLDNPDANRRKERLTITADVVVLYRAWLNGLGIRTAADLEPSSPPAPDWVSSTGACSRPRGSAATLDGNPVTDSLISAVAAGGAMELLLTANGRILNLGRSSRTFSPTQRRALLALWGGCACCGAEPERCDIHHVHAVGDTAGSPTSPTASPNAGAATSTTTANAGETGSNPTAPTPSPSPTGPNDTTAAATTTASSPSPRWPPPPERPAPPATTLKPNRDGPRGTNPTSSTSPETSSEPASPTATATPTPNTSATDSTTDSTNSNEPPDPTPRLSRGVP